MVVMDLAKLIRVPDLSAADGMRWRTPEKPIEIVG